MLGIERSNRRSVSAHHVIGKDLELRLLIHLSPRREKNSLGFHGTIGLLRRLLYDHLPLKHPNSVVIDDCAIEFPARASRRGMNHLQRRIGAPDAVYERQSAKRHLGALSRDPDENLPAGKLPARNEAKGGKLCALRKLENLRFNVQPGRVANDHNMLRYRAIGQRQNRRSVPLDAGMRPLEYLDKRCLRSRAERKSHPRID